MKKEKNGGGTGLRRMKHQGAESVAVDIVLKIPIRLLHAPEIVFLLAMMLCECYRD